MAEPKENPVDHISNCCEKVRLKVYEYFDYELPARRSSTPIVRAISEISGWHIIERQIGVEEMPELRGMLIPFPEYEQFVAYVEARPPLADLLDGVPVGSRVAVILLSEGSNTCWRRWTRVKEASHLLFEGDSLFEWGDVEALCNSLVEPINFSNEEDLQALSDSGRLDYFARESIGVVGAMELFMSEAALKAWAQNAINVKNLDDKEIASRLKLPRRFVELRLKQWGLIS